MHAVKFFKQSMWRRRQRSQGGTTCSPRCSSSIRATICILYGPLSSFSCWADRGGGRRDDGVLGIGTVVGADVYILYSPGSDALGFGRDDGRFTCPVGSSSPRAWRSAVVKNLFINSARVVGDAPLIEVPLIMVTLSVLDCGNANDDDSGLSSGAGSPAPGRLALTATKPAEGEWADEEPLPSPFNRARTCPFGSRKVGLRERGGCEWREVSFSRRETMAVLRFLRRWFSCLARADTEAH